MEILPSKDFFLEYLFTEKGSIVEIESMEIQSSTFVQANRAKGFQMACAEVIEQTIKTPGIRYSIKKISMNDCEYYMDFETIQCFLCLPSVQLEELSYLNDTITFQWDSWYQEMITFCSNLKAGQFHSLKVLRLQNLQSILIEINQFVELFIFNPKIQLKELKLIDIYTSMNREHNQSLKNMVEQSEGSSLEILSFGLFYQGIGENVIIEHVIFNKKVNLKSLTLKRLKLLEHLVQIENLLENHSADNPLKFLDALEIDNINISTKEDWLRVIKIFIINQRFTLQKLKIKEQILDQSFSQALNQLLLPFEYELFNAIKQYQEADDMVRDRNDQKMFSQQQNGSLALPFALITLNFENCQILDDVLSGFLVICELKNLQIINCQDFNYGIKKSMDLIKSLQLDQHYLYKIKSFSLESTILSDIEAFKILIEEIILNQNRQMLEILNLQDCNLDDEMLQIISKQLLAIKEEQKLYNRVFLLQDLNMTNNDSISDISWQQLWDVLLNESKFEKKEDIPIFQSIVNPSLELTEFEKDKENIINETEKLIQISQLCLKEKILYNYKKFTPQFPKQITSLTLEMNFANLSETQLKLEYYRLIVGFIIHPESSLINLELNSLNMIIFIKACLEAYEFSKLYSEQSMKQPKQNHQCAIKSINFTNLIDNDFESTSKFIQIFLCSKHIKLNKLQISKCTQPILHLILQNINRREDYELEELQLQDLQETLNLEDSITYCQWLIFGQKMPIKILNSTPNLAEMNQETFDQFLLQNVKVKSIYLKYTQNTSNNMKIYSVILSKLIQYGLQEITFDLTDATSIIIETFNKINNLDNLILKKLIFTGNLKINKSIFEKLSILFEKLELFKVQQLLLENESEIYDFCQLIDINQSKNLRFEVKQVICTTPNEFFKKILFNPNFGITEVVLRDPQLLESHFEICDFGQKIRYFMLNMNLFYYSSDQLNVNALETISQMLIYNESSNLEELILYQCHFKIAGVKALCKYSNALREKIENEGRQKTAQLKLKRVTMFYSMQIGDDSVEIFSKDLLYFEYINIERIEVLVIQMNDEMISSLCLAAKSWLQFQKVNQRQYQTRYPIKYLDIGRNEFVNKQESWIIFLRTLVFTDNTPHLETFNINFMTFNDLKTKHLTTEALQFFSNKPSDYKFNIKKINFAQNTQLTHLGWQDVFKNFFFHPKVHLEELNMISTRLDTQQKLNIITEVIRERALTSLNKKVPLHTFLCYNVSLKNYIADYLSEQPSNYQIPYDLPQEIDYDYSINCGSFDGYPEVFGDVLQMFQYIIKLRQKISYQSDWQDIKSKYSPYHLNLCDHYLNILNQYYTIKGNSVINIYLSLQTLNNFANYFEYTTEYPGSPYPYNLIFQQRTFDYFKEKQCNIFKIKIIQIEFDELEQINQFQIFKLWQKIKHQSTSIDQIQIEYDLNDDLVDQMFMQGFDERDIINLIRIFPPSRIRIQNSLSIQAIKGIYSILHDTYYFKYAMISYSYDNFLNIGIGYSLREVFYNYNAVGPISKFIKQILYKCFNIFVKPTKKYLFDDQVKQLNVYLSQQKLYFFIIVITNILFFVITLAGPYLFTYKLLDRDESQLTKSYLCVNGTSKEASYLYYGFAALTLITEAILYYKVAQLVPKHAERIIINKVVYEEQEEDQKQHPIVEQIHDIQSNKILPAQEEVTTMLKKKPTTDQSPIQGISRFQKMATAINKRISSVAGKITSAVTTQAEEFTQSKMGILLSYAMTLLSSQLFKFDLYNDVVFILNAYNCEEFMVFILALIITAFSQGIYILHFLYLICDRVVQNQKTAKLLSSKFINDFYSISFIGRNVALSTILDSSAPFNVIIIPNTIIGRYIFPHHAGRAMSNLVKSFFFQFLFEDLPQTLLQMYFVVSQALKRSKDLQVQVYISICTAIFTALLSFYKFLSIRPTNLLQDDFDLMSARLSKGYNQQIQNCLQQEQTQIQTFIDLYNTPDHESVPVEQLSEERQTLLN